MQKNTNHNMKKVLSEGVRHEKNLSKKSKVKCQSSDFRNGRYEVAEYKGVGYVSVAEELGL